MAEIPLVLMRWLHISSVAILIGGMIYGRLVSGAEQNQAARRFRPLVWGAVAALIFSGVFNIVNSPGHSARYHMLLGIKLLLAAHVFGVAGVVAGGKHPRTGRLMTGAAISGLIMIAISAYLRRIF